VDAIPQPAGRAGRGAAREVGGYSVMTLSRGPL
jgi:hypothetical protein